MVKETVKNRFGRDNYDSIRSGLWSRRLPSVFEVSLPAMD
jgi:hypothetical protein